MKKINNLLLVMLLICGLFILSVQAEEYSKENPMKVAFVYHAAVGDFGWFYGHDKAREITDEELDWAKTSRLENVKPGAQAERVFKELCKEDYKVIVAASMDYQSDILKVAEEYPDVAFLIASGDICKEPNIESYFPQRTQIWYLLGQLAAQLSDSGTIGMVGSIVFPLGLQINNAWLLGAQSINPDITERLIFVNSFFDPAAERDAALSLIDAGADVICQGTNTAAHVQAAEEMGVYAMSQWENMKKFGPKAYATGEVFNWDRYYVETFTAIKNGTWKARMYYPEFKKGVADISEFGPMITDEMKKKYEETRAKLLEDPMSIWEGPIYDTDGKLRVKSGERISEEDFMTMGWYVKGIITSMKNK